MTIIQAIILGLIQGVTEFIPVSSSGHLTLVPWLVGWSFDPTYKYAFDVMAHWGTLAAVVAVFWPDLWALVRGGLRTLGFEKGVIEGSPEPDGTRASGLAGWAQGFVSRVRADHMGRLAWLIVIGSIPAVVLGLAFEGLFEMLFATPLAVSLFLCGTALLLAVSEWQSAQERAISELSWLDALLIGLGQALAIAPGISRSGATIASGLMRGVQRKEAARFSFLLSTPVIVGAGVWQLKDLLAAEGWAVGLGPLLCGFACSAVAGYLCIRFLLRYLQRGRLYPFAIYCAAVGLSCFVLALIR
jgi:undecaprenyl-diphosphatase